MRLYEWRVQAAGMPVLFNLIWMHRDALKEQFKSSLQMLTAQAAMNGHTTCIAELARLGVDMNPKNKDGRTPLHMARDSFACASLLLPWT
jgi:hypothetical protein